jgi:hypothetical protein
MLGEVNEFSKEELSACVTHYIVHAPNLSSRAARDRDRAERRPHRLATSTLGSLCISASTVRSFSRLGGIRMTTACAQFLLNKKIGREVCSRPTLELFEV